MKTIYVAGPYTNGDPSENTDAAMAVGHALMDLGLAPYVPHLSHFMHLQRPRGYEDWMGIDFAWVRRSDALLRMAGDSKGADREVSLARELGIPVFHSIPEVRAWLGR